MSPDVTSFNYDEAFSRNIGWVTEAEQQSLRGKRVAIAGLGGVGGVHLLTLARLGIGRFAIADLDRFDLVNFNRQVGATTRRWASRRSRRWRRWPGTSIPKSKSHRSKTE